jgi:hypothetical protein
MTARPSRPQVGAALEIFPMQKQKNSFGSTYARKKTRKTSWLHTQNNLCHPHNRQSQLSTMEADIDTQVNIMHI